MSKPHIGTFRLVGMVEKMRAKIIALGGEIRFGCRVEEIEIERDASGAGGSKNVNALNISTMPTRRNVPMCGLLTYKISSGAPASTNSRSTLRP